MTDLHAKRRLTAVRLRFTPQYWEEKATAFLQSLGDLPIQIEAPTPTRMFVSVRALLPAKYKLTAYDASYLELAIRRGLPMAVFDNALATAACAAGVNVLEL